MPATQVTLQERSACICATGCVLGRGLCSLAEVHDEAAVVEAAADGVALAIEVGVLERDLLPSGRILDCRGLDYAHPDLCPRLRTDGVAEDVRRVDAFEALLDAKLLQAVDSTGLQQLTDDAVGLRPVALDNQHLAASSS